MIHAVIFDLDGTITKPFLDFGQIRSEIGGSISRIALLEQISEMPEKEQARANDILRKHEISAAENAEYNPGMPEVLAFVKEQGLDYGIITRNCRESTSIILEKLGIRSDAVITRDSGFPPKPAPDAFLFLCKRWKIDPTQVIMIGDHGFDVQTGKAAGALAAYLTNGKVSDTAVDADYVIHNAYELLTILKELVSG